MENNARAALIAALESKRCPLSTDGGGTEQNHFISGGACVICDMTPRRLADLHGVAA